MSPDGSIHDGGIARGAQGGGRILLVEDNELNRDMLSRRLVRKGYSVEFAETAPEAVAKAWDWCPDLILMDISLGETNGLDATREIRSGSGDGARVPIIALTAHALTSDRDSALAAGCDDFETKPIDFERLLGKMANLLQRV